MFTPSRRVFTDGIGSRRLRPASAKAQTVSALEKRFCTHAVAPHGFPRPSAREAQRPSKSTCRPPTAFRIQKACPVEPFSSLPRKSTPNWPGVLSPGERGLFLAFGTSAGRFRCKSIFISSRLRQSCFNPGSTFTVRQARISRRASRTRSKGSPSSGMTRSSPSVGTARRFARGTSSALLLSSPRGN